MTLLLLLMLMPQKTLMFTVKPLPVKIRNGSPATQRYNHCRALKTRWQQLKSSKLDARGSPA
jgi:hypothetical protein